MKKHPRRLRRLKKINVAVRDLESCLFTMRDHYKVTWTESGFKNLYYLAKLAREARV